MTAQQQRIIIALAILLPMLVFISTPEAAGDGPLIEYARERKTMLEHDLKGRDISDPNVLKAMDQVPRHLFVAEEFRPKAYADYPLPIGHGQTISQPYIVAFMTQALQLTKDDRVLEIGTGSGYQAAVMSLIAGSVYTVEIHPALAREAQQRLAALGYANVSVRAGDGFFGWPEAAPFDAIMLTCAADTVPAELVKQLKEGGRIIMPLGGRLQAQDLIIGTKRNGALKTTAVLPVRFVPMTGRIEE